MFNEPTILRRLTLQFYRFLQFDSFASQFTGDYDAISFPKKAYILTFITTPLLTQRPSSSENTRTPQKRRTDNHHRSRVHKSELLSALYIVVERRKTLRHLYQSNVNIFVAFKRSEFCITLFTMRFVWGFGKD